MKTFLSIAAAAALAFGLGATSASAQDNTTSIPCITCNGGSITIGAYAMGGGTVVGDFQAPNPVQGVIDVTSFSNQELSGESYLNLGAGVENGGSLYGNLGVRQTAMGEMGQYLQNNGGSGVYSMMNSMGTRVDGSFMVGAGADAPSGN